MARAPRIVVVGSSNTDLVIESPRLPSPGETVLGGDFLRAPGGKGANQAVAAARLGGAVTLVARVGSDDFGEAAIQGFEESGIDTRFVVRDPEEPSGVALIMVGEAGENLISVASGANGALSPADVDAAAGVIRQADLLLLQLEVPLATVVHAARLGFEAGVGVILDPAPARDLPEELLFAINLLTPNESEAERLTGVPVRDLESARRATAALRERGAEAVLLTMGAAGCWIDDPRGGQRVPGFPVDAIDTTAAGDTFNGALACALGEGQPLEAAAMFANAAAALAVTRRGAQPSMPCREDVERLLAS